MSDPERPTAGLDLGCGRVSTTTRHLQRQLDALNAAGIPPTQIWTDKKTGIPKTSLDRYLIDPAPKDHVPQH